MFKFWKPKKGKELKPTHSIWKTGLSARKPFRDSDKDKVIDIFDCQPRNRMKQGEEHEDYGAFNSKAEAQAYMRKVMEKAAKYGAEHPEKYADADE
jgi:thioredoxin reductase